MATRKIQRSNSVNEEKVADLRDPKTGKNYRYHPRTGKVSVDGQYLDGGGSPGPDVPGRIMPHPQAKKRKSKKSRTA